MLDLALLTSFIPSVYLTGFLVFGPLSSSHAALLMSSSRSGLGDDSKLEIFAMRDTLFEISLRRSRIFWALR